MKRLLLILVCLGLSLGASAQIDTTGRYAGLDSLLTQFYAALEREEVPVKNAEFDTLIGSCKDSLTRQHVALSVFDHYRFSRVMGEEAVAVHIFDEWIAPGRVETRSEFELFEAERFALENRSTLLGMTAPKVTLKKVCGGKKTIPDDGRISVLFFYSPGCAKCRLETQVLPSVLAEVQFPMNFYAVNTDTDRRAWKAFRKALNAGNTNRKVRMVHLWDPENESSMLIDYGIFSTPKVFVAMEDGEIIGRRLEMENLLQIIQYINILYGEEKED